MRPRSGLLGLAIRLALADSSIVTLALPDVLRDFDVSITTVAWVLTAYNLVLAVTAVPAAYVARCRPVAAFAAGALTFAAASLAVTGRASVFIDADADRRGFDPLVMHEGAIITVELGAIELRAGGNVYLSDVRTRGDAVITSAHGARQPRNGSRAKKKPSPNARRSSNTPSAWKM